eukprot:gnl/TRDRNA2_/TRDRNA2_177205_c1_seq14.p1 gnl/TRDRNA2_/TRDRNA2_177205_c1~~gnl/TRDRNA2_/TRDRNA2_177205_c1_seq14.p1  ORF type:complete len:197 (+),score=37.87 gnl/TRDRNA2_/TRDRNA2_177205_c1_seq14:70-591(+)
MPASQLAGLKECHVAALRLYTSSSYKKLNGPLRARVRPHPFKVTVFFLAKALIKMRLVQAKLDPEAFAAEIFLWRGMANVTTDMDKLKKQGGTELAPMSTSADKSVAIKYAASESPLIFRYKAQGLAKGVSIKFLSLYPKEEEYLYPPGTLLNWQSTEVLDGYTTVTVLPQMA